MRENKGHARCNAFGIRYVFQNKEFDNQLRPKLFSDFSGQKKITENKRNQLSNQGVQRFSGSAVCLVASSRVH